MQLIEPVFEPESFDDAMSCDFSSLGAESRDLDASKKKYDQTCYLQRVYFIVQDAMFGDRFRPTDEGLFHAWVDQLWRSFLTEERDLHEFVPNSAKSGYTVHTLLWVVLCGLTILRRRWYGRRPVDGCYARGASASSLPTVMRLDQLSMNDVPVREHTVSEMLSQLFCLVSKFNGVEYHTELEIWVEWLHARVCDLIYTAGPESVFDSPSWCEKRSKNVTFQHMMKTLKVTDESRDALYGVKDSFVQLTCRIFYEIKNQMLRYKMFPRTFVTFGGDYTEMDEYDVTPPDVNEVVLPTTATYKWNRRFVSENFFSGDENRARGTLCWKTFVDSKLQKYYHDRSRRTLQKSGTEDLLRIAEKSRSIQFNQGIAPSWQEILKRNRSTNAIENITSNVFRVEHKKLFDYVSDPCARPERLYDFIFLNVLDQYMSNEFGMNFSRRFVRTHSSWENDIGELDTQEYPVIVQIMNNYDVCRRGTFIQTGSLVRAFIVWCALVNGDHESKIREVDLSPLMRAMSLVRERPEETRERITTWIEDSDRWC